MTALRHDDDLCLDSSVKGWERAWAALIDQYGSADGWEYMASESGNHVFRNRYLTPDRNTWFRVQWRPTDDYDAVAAAKQQV